MRSATAAGAAYFVIMFGVGFILSTGQVVPVEPALGGTFAVVLEVPMMLAIAWLGCVHPSVAGRAANSFAAGHGSNRADAFACRRVTARARLRAQPGRQVVSMLTSAGLLGLLAQLSAAAFRLLRLRRNGPHS